MWRCRRTGRTSERTPLANARGLTLLELLLVTVLFGLFVGAAYEVVIVGLRTVSSADDRELLRMTMVRALDRMTREAALADDVDRAQDARFQFDTDGLNNINYVYSSGSLTRSDANTSAVTILSNLTSFDFNYLELNGTAAQSSCDSTSSCGSNCCRDDVRVVQITMTATKDNDTISVAGAACLRNR